MDLFLKYFTPAICLIIIGTTPLYLTRVYLYFKRWHFLLHINSVRLAMYMHGAIYLIFNIVLVFYWKYLIEHNIIVYMYIIMGIILIGLYIGYRYQFLNTKRTRYSVVFSKWNNRDAWQKHLDERHLGNVDITEGAFSFVSKISFTSMERPEIETLLKSFKQEEHLLHPYNTKKAYGLLALQAFMIGISIVSFVLFFVLIPSL